jgi:hypothetical protein
MVTSDLVLHNVTISVPRINVFLRCRHFLGAASLAKPPYQVLRRLRGHEAILFSDSK